MPPPPPPPPPPPRPLPPASRRRFTAQEWIGFGLIAIVLIYLAKCVNDERLRQNALMDQFEREREQNRQQYGEPPPRKR
jgi:hypothetical protein